MICCFKRKPKTTLVLCFIGIATVLCLLVWCNEINVDTSPVKHFYNIADKSILEQMVA